MSLLLDALKKAAEQKAQKSKQEDLSQRASDETLLEADAADFVAGNGVAGPLQNDDETEFEHTDLRARLERGERIAGDDTGLDISEFDDSARAAEQTSITTGEETGLDYPDATSTGFGEAATGARSVDEETGIDLAGQAPEASTDPSQAPAPQQSDDTGLTISEESPPVVDEPASLESGDDTGLDVSKIDQSASADVDQQMLSDDDETIVAETEGPSEIEVDQKLDGLHPAQPADETDLSLVDRQVEEPGQGPGANMPVSDQTDISVPPSRADEIESASPELPPSTGDLELVDMDGELPAEDETDSSETSPGHENALTDEDMSLLLIEPEQLGPDGVTSFTNPQVPVDRARSQAGNNVNRAEAKPADITDRSIPGAPVPGAVRPGETTDTQASTLTNLSLTAISGDDTRTGTLAAPTGNKVTRPADVTSTHTYAPDNYDRTLMKLPSDDASDLFAGMRAESDVVMTPDYAKKVFRSKTSAQRVQHYKYYFGIAVALFLAIAIYGGVEYQQESDRIDTTMRPLKRDPMPGLIRQQKPSETRLFAETDNQVDARTIEIIETAVEESPPDSVATSEPASEDNLEVAPETDVAVQLEPESDAIATIDTEADPADPVVAEPVTETAEVELETRTQPIVTASVTTGSTTASAPETIAEIPSSGEVGVDPGLDAVDETDAGNSANLQIRTSNSYRDVDIWLAEAYSAYQAGNNSLALAQYNKVLEVDSGNRNALLARAAINIQDGNIDSAIQDYQQLLLANPKDSVAMSSLLSVSSFSPLETESQLKLMIRDEPDSPYLNFALANAYGAQNRWQEAQGHYFTALQNNPGDPNYAYNLAVSLEHISQPGSAITYYRRALENINNGLATFSREVVGQRLEVLEKL